MGKPLDLKHFHIWKNGLDGTLYADRPGERWPVRVEVEVHRKRLTDAELAAEVNAAIFHEAECEVRGLRVGAEHPHFEHWVKWNHEFGRRAVILERFATLPHHDEDEVT